MGDAGGDGGAGLVSVPIPASLRVQRNTAAEAELLEAARAWVEGDLRDPTEIHVSDLLAQRLAYWRRVSPKPLSDRLVTVFLVGKVLHAFVVSAVDGQAPGALDLNVQDAGPIHDAELGVVLSPDLIHRGIIRELKTTRAFYAPKYQDDIDNYLEQLVCYMASQRHTTAQLWVLFLNLRDESRKTRPEFRAFSVTAPMEELETVREWMTRAVTEIRTALRASDPAPLPLCPGFMCGRTNCQWFEDCRPEGRWKP